MSKKISYLCFRFKAFKHKTGRNLSFRNLSDFTLCKFLKRPRFFKRKIDYDMIALEQYNSSSLLVYFK